MRYLFRFFLLLAALTYAPAGLFAAADSVQLLHFSIKDGFPSNNVYSVIQDRHGYLWFTTDNGVVKYNGYSFKVFNTENGLPGDDVWKLYEDSGGRIWLHSYTYQIGYLENDQYHKLPLAVSRSVITPIDITEKNGVVVFYYFKNRVLLTFVLVGKDFIYEIPAATLNIWQLTPQGVLYVTGRNREQIYRRDIFEPNAKFRYLDSIKDFEYRFLSRNRIFNEKKRYYMSYDNGSATVGFINTAKDSAYTVAVSDLLQGTPGETVYTVADRPPGYQFVTSKRVCTIDYAFREINNDTISYAIASQSQIAFRLTAKNNDHWYTTTSQGIYQHIAIHAPFRRDNLHSLVPNAVFVSEGIDGNLYWQDKISNSVYVTDSDGHVSKLPFEHCGKLYSVLEHRRDPLTYFSFSNGMYEIDRDTRQYRLFLQKFKRVVLQNSYSGNLEKNDPAVFITPLQKEHFKNQRSMISIGRDEFLTTSINTVFYFHAHDTEMTARAINNERYSSIFYDTVYRRCVLYNDNKIAICTLPGMQLTYFSAEYLNGLGIKDIESIIPDGHGNFFIKTGYDLFVYVSATGKLQKLFPGVNLFNCKVLLYKNYVFIAGPFGIGYMKNESDGSNAAMHVAVNARNFYYTRLNDMVVTRPGNMLLNTDNGFYTVSLDSMLGDNGLLQPTDNNPFHLLLNAPYQKNIHNGDTLQIDQGTDKLTLNAINYYGNGVVSYSYVIHGTQSDWQQSASGEIQLSRLKPGRYWKVTCIIKDDVWRNFPVSFYIYHPLFWWQTKTWQIVFWTTGIALFILILLSVFLLTRYYVARANEKKRLLTDLELRAIHAQINPHFIFNTLSTALYFIHRQEVEKAYTHVNKFSHLLRAYLKSSRNRYVTLADEISMIRKYIELQQARFEERFDYSINVENKIPAANIQIPSLLLQPLVENAITHGLFHKKPKEKGLLEIHFRQGNATDELICIIEDNGIGRIKAAELSRDSITEARESYGSKLTEELISIFRQYEQMNIDMEYIDKQEPDSGTIVKLTIKNIRYVA